MVSKAILAAVLFSVITLTKCHPKLNKIEGHLYSSVQHEDHASSEESAEVLNDQAQSAHKHPKQNNADENTETSLNANSERGMFPLETPEQHHIQYRSYPKQRIYHSSKELQGRFMSNQQRHRCQPHCPRETKPSTNHLEARNEIRGMQQHLQ